MSLKKIKANLQVYDNSVTEDEISSSLIGWGLVGGDGVPISCSVDNSTIGFNGFFQLTASEESLDHNSLFGLQGGTASEYYHLTSASYFSASNFSASFVKLMNIGDYSHNDLSTLQGGDEGDYYHLTSESYLSASNFSASFADLMDIGDYSHNDLSTLQGAVGAEDEYYHLTSASYFSASNFSASFVKLMNIGDYSHNDLDGLEGGYDPGEGIEYYHIGSQSFVDIQNGISFSSYLIVDVRHSVGGTPEIKSQSVVFTNGILTETGSISDWLSAPIL